jgi:hypothetical protein
MTVQDTEFSFIVKKYLHGTERSGQFICIIPKDIADSKTMDGKYIWMNNDDIIAVASGVIDTKLKNRFAELVMFN